MRVSNIVILAYVMMKYTHLKVKHGLNLYAKHVTPQPRNTTLIFFVLVLFPSVIVGGLLLKFPAEHIYKVFHILGQLYFAYRYIVGIHLLTKVIA